MERRAPGARRTCVDESFSCREKFQPASPARPAQPMDLYFILFQNINQPNHVFYFYKIPYFTFLQNTAQPASDYKIYSAGHRTEDHCQQPASQTSQPSRPSQPGRPSQPSIALAHSILYFRKISLACQSRQAAKLGIYYFYEIPYFAFLQNTAPPASGPGTTAGPAQPSQLASKHS